MNDIVLTDIDIEKQEELTLLDIITVIEKHKIEICYYEFSNISVKIHIPTGWYIKEHNKEYTLSRQPQKLYDTYYDCVLDAARIYNAKD